MHWLQSLNAVSTIRALRDNAEAQRNEELERALNLLQSGKDPEKIMSELANRLTNKLIHTPSVMLKKAAYDSRDDIFETAQELFDLKNPQL